MSPQIGCTGARGWCLGPVPGLRGERANSEHWQSMSPPSQVVWAYQRSPIPVGEALPAVAVGREVEPIPRRSWVILTAPIVRRACPALDVAESGRQYRTPSSFKEEADSELGW